MELMDALNHENMDRRINPQYKPAITINHIAHAIQKNKTFRHLVPW